MTEDSNCNVCNWNRFHLLFWNNVPQVKKLLALQIFFFFKKVRRMKANRAWVDFIVCQLLLKEANGQSWPWWILIIRWKVLIKQISWDCRLPARAHQTPKSRDWFERTTQDQDQPLPMNQISPKFSTQPVVSMHSKNWTIKTPGEVWKCLFFGTQEQYFISIHVACSIFHGCTLVFRLNRPIQFLDLYWKNWGKYSFIRSRVAKVVRRQEGPLPKSLDLDENFTPYLTLV